MRKESLDGDRIFVIHDFLSAEECRSFIARSEETGTGAWHAVGLNERFRFYRYDPGQKFAVHYDGCFRRGDGERSQLTFMIYLNEGFTGGETKFYRDDRTSHVAVHPRRGMALVFAHLQLHEGAPVLDGRKYVLRTDVVYSVSAPGTTI